MEIMKSKTDTPTNLKKALLFSVFITLLILVFPTVSGAIVVIFELNELQGRLVQTSAFLLAGLIGIVIARIKYGSWKSVFFCGGTRFSLKDLLWFAPLIFVELLSFIYGMKEGLNFNKVMIYLLFTASVGFAEELYFRGLIPKSMIEKSFSLAILTSSFLFSVGHFLNLLAGASVFDTVLQVIFAFIFGFVAIEIFYMTGNLAIPILWHWIHNFLSLVTMVNDGKFSVYIGIIQGIILILYGFFLWTKLKSRRKAESQIVI